MNIRRMLATLALAGGLVLTPAAVHAAPRAIVVKCTGAGKAVQVATPNLPGVPALNAPMGESPCHVRSCYDKAPGSRLWIGSWKQPFPPSC